MAENTAAKRRSIRNFIDFKKDFIYFSSKNYNGPGRIIMVQAGSRAGRYGPAARRAGGRARALWYVNYGNFDPSSHPEQVIELVASKKR